MNGTEVRYLGQRIDQLAVRLDRYEQLQRELVERLARIEQSTQHTSPDDIREILERLARLESSVNAGANLLRWIIPLFFTALTAYTGILFWILEQLSR